MTIDLEVAPAGPDDRDACLALRHTVFVIEQGVPRDLEIDEHDATAQHWIARRGEREVGTARARLVGADAKAERVAVLRSERRAGVGRALMEAIEAWARERGLSGVRLHAQLEAVAFYRDLGYRPDGATFEEAGIEHLAMYKGLVPSTASTRNRDHDAAG